MRVKLNISWDRWLEKSTYKQTSYSYNMSSSKSPWIHRWLSELPWTAETCLQWAVNYCYLHTRVIHACMSSGHSHRRMSCMSNWIHLYHETVDRKITRVRLKKDHKSRINKQLGVEYSYMSSSKSRWVVHKIRGRWLNKLPWTAENLARKHTLPNQPRK